MPECKSCGAPVRWVRTESGALNPLNPEPHEDGNMIEGEGGRWRAVTPGEGTHRSHFATCPDADEHRRR